MPVTFIGGAATPKPVLATYEIGSQNNADGAIITKPTGVVSGDLLIIVIAHASSTAGTTPSGFTLLTNQTNGSFLSLNVYYRVSNGADGGPFTNDLPGSAVDCAWFCGRFTFRQGNPEGADASATDANPDPPTLAPSWGASIQSLILAATGWAGDFLQSQATVSTYPYSNNQLTAASSGGTAQVSIAVCTQNLFTASVDPGTFTISESEDWCAATVAIESS
jgi:hypothetical protein